MKKLKKIIRVIKKIIRSIISLVDKFLVTPITKIAIFIGEKKEKNGGKFERWLNRRNTLVFISLILAVSLFFYVDSNSNLVVDSSAEVLRNQTVEATYNKEAYVIEGVPETADVTLIGRTVDLYLAKQLSTGKVTVDLSNLKEGSHKVDLNYDTSINSVSYNLSPSSITVYVYPKVSATKLVTVDVINKDKLDSKLSVQSVSIDREDVIIKGAEKNLKKVAAVKALVDIDKIVDPTAGVNTVDDVKLVAYDSNGNLVDVEMVPNKVVATVNIESYSGEAKIKIVPTGKLSFGKAISSITSSVNKIKIYGDEDVVKKYIDSYIPIEVDVTALSNNKTYTVVVPKPEGIREVSEKTITVKISLGEEQSKEIENIQIDGINVGPNLKASAIGANSSKTTVIVKGTKEVLENIDTTAIKAVVDLSGLGEGEHTVKVTVTGDEVKASYIPKTTMIKVKITKG